MKNSVVLCIYILTVILSNNINDSFTATSVCNEVCEEYYNGYELVWETSEDYTWDLLKTIISDDGIIVAEYEYDQLQHRVIKRSDGCEEKYSYNDFNRIESVENENGIIEYTYYYDYYTKLYYVSEASYCGEIYNFVYENGVISTLCNNNKKIVEYQYDEFGNINHVIDLTSGTPVENTDPSFIGNINKIRYNTAFYDDETGWYYKNRYYDPEHYRFVDGIMYDDAIKMLANTEDMEEKTRIYLRINTVGLPLVFHNEILSPTRNSNGSNISNSEVVARVICAEAGSREYDWYDVAKVIYNRMTTPNAYGGNTAYAVVSNGEFSAYSDGRYMSVELDSQRWYDSVLLSLYLDLGQMPVSNKIYIGGQTSFRSVNTFIQNYGRNSNEQSTIEGNVIRNIAFRPLPDEEFNGMYPNELTELIMPFSVFYNVYFNE